MDYVPLRPVDKWLNGMGFFRKHMPFDDNSLFRCIAEQVYENQFRFTDVFNEFIDFLKDQHHAFEHLIEEDFQGYIDKLTAKVIIPGQIEMKIIAKKYKSDFLIFDANDFTITNVSQYDFGKTIKLCLLSNNHYDSVHKKAKIDNAAFCQALVYKLLYENVFKIKNVDDISREMLHSPTNSKSKNFTFTNDANISTEYDNNNPNWISYKVAKALDPNHYRNIEFDCWSQSKKDMRKKDRYMGDDDLKVGTLCLAKIDDELLECYIQEMNKNNEKCSCIVYVCKLVTKIEIDRSNLYCIPNAEPWPLPYKIVQNLRRNQIQVNDETDNENNTKESNNPESEQMTENLMNNAPHESDNSQTIEKLSDNSQMIENLTNNAPLESDTSQMIENLTNNAPYESGSSSQMSENLTISTLLETESSSQMTENLTNNIQQESDGSSQMIGDLSNNSPHGSDSSSSRKRACEYLDCGTLFQANKRTRKMSSDSSSSSACYRFDTSPEDFDTSDDILSLSDNSMSITTSVVDESDNSNNSLRIPSDASIPTLINYANTLMDMQENSSDMEYENNLPDTNVSNIIAIAESIISHQSNESTGRMEHETSEIETVILLPGSEERISENNSSTDVSNENELDSLIFSTNRSSRLSLHATETDYLRETRNYFARNSIADSRIRAYLRESERIRRNFENFRANNRPAESLNANDLSLFPVHMKLNSDESNENADRTPRVLSNSDLPERVISTNFGPSGNDSLSIANRIRDILIEPNRSVHIVTNRINMANRDNDLFNHEVLLDFIENSRYMLSNFDRLLTNLTARRNRLFRSRRSSNANINFEEDADIDIMTVDSEINTVNVATNQSQNTDQPNPISAQIFRRREENSDSSTTSAGETNIANSYAVQHRLNASTETIYPGSFVADREFNLNFGSTDNYTVNYLGYENRYRNQSLNTSASPLFIPAEAYPAAGENNSVTTPSHPIHVPVPINYAHHIPTSNGIFVNQVAAVCPLCGCQQYSGASYWNGGFIHPPTPPPTYAPHNSQLPHYFPIYHEVVVHERLLFPASVGRPELSTTDYLNNGNFLTFRHEGIIESCGFCQNLLHNYRNYVILIRVPIMLNLAHEYYAPSMYSHVPNGHLPIIASDENQQTSTEIVAAPTTSPNVEFNISNNSTESYNVYINNLTIDSNAVPDQSNADAAITIEAQVDYEDDSSTAANNDSVATGNDTSIIRTYSSAVRNNLNATETSRDDRQQINCTPAAISSNRRYHSRIFPSSYVRQPYNNSDRFQSYQNRRWFQNPRFAVQQPLSRASNEREYTPASQIAFPVSQPSRFRHTTPQNHFRVSSTSANLNSPRNSNRSGRTPQTSSSVNNNGGNTNSSRTSNVQTNRADQTTASSASANDNGGFRSSSRNSDNQTARAQQTSQSTASANNNKGSGNPSRNSNDQTTQAHQIPQISSSESSNEETINASGTSNDQSDRSLPSPTPTLNNESANLPEEQRPNSSKKSTEKKSSFQRVYNRRNKKNKK